MNGIVEKLNEDLRKKLGRLRWMIDNPRIHVSEHFFDIRNSIDIDVETLMSDLQEKRDEEEAAQVNETRREFIRILKEMEEATLKYLATSILPEWKSETFTSLEQRVENFKETLRQEGDESDNETEYVQLAFELLEKRNSMEKCLFGDQSVVYMHVNKQTGLGHLIYFPEDYLSPEEIECLKKANTKIHFHDIFKMLEAATKRSILVSGKKEERKKPLVLTKNSVIIRQFEKVLTSIKDSDSRFFFFAKSKEQCFGYSADNSNLALQLFTRPVLEKILLIREFCLRHYARYKKIASEEEIHLSAIAGLATNEEVFKYCSSIELNITNCSLSLSTNLSPFFEGLARLTVERTVFASSNLELLARCVNLKSLSFKENTFPENKYDLGFLSALVELESLSLTLPDSEWDFDFLERFDRLTRFKIEPVSNGAQKKLSKQALVQISKACLLQKLTLHDFDIESIDAEIMIGFRALKYLRIYHNRIKFMEENAFRRAEYQLTEIKMIGNEMSDDLGVSMFNYIGSLSELTFSHNTSQISGLTATTFRDLTALISLVLVNNKIDQLPQGVFDNLAHLQELTLNRNHIEEIGRDTFDRLVNLVSLELCCNPIKDVPANTFAKLNKLEKLDLSGCELTSINNQMFNGLVELNTLHLCGNLIASIDVIDEDGQSVVTFKANLTPEDISHVKRLLFKDLINLKELELSGNKLEKLDFNYFFNLQQLIVVFLTSNMLIELNRRAEPDLLPTLQCIFLNKNQLSFIDQQALPRSRSLTHLFLAENKLERLDDDFFATYINLCNLDLSKNCLSMQITENTFASCRDMLRTLFLQENKAIEEIGSGLS